MTSSRYVLSDATRLHQKAVRVDRITLTPRAVVARAAPHPDARFRQAEVLLQRDHVLKQSIVRGAS